MTLNTKIPRKRRYVYVINDIAPCSERVKREIRKSVSKTFDVATKNEVFIGNSPSSHYIKVINPNRAISELIVRLKKKLADTPRENIKLVLIKSGGLMFDKQAEKLTDRKNVIVLPWPGSDGSLADIGKLPLAPGNKVVLFDDTSFNLPQRMDNLSRGIEKIVGEGNVLSTAIIANDPEMRNVTCLYTPNKKMLSGCFSTEWRASDLRSVSGPIRSKLMDKVIERKKKNMPWFKGSL